MSAHLQGVATEGQRTLARVLLDAEGDGWVRTATLLERCGIGHAALSLALTRRVEWGWVERRTLPGPGAPAEWRATDEGRVRLRHVLLAERQEAEPSTAPTAAEVRRWAGRLGFEYAGRAPRPLMERWNREHPDRPVAIPEVDSKWGDPEYGRRGGLANRKAVTS